MFYFRGTRRLIVVVLHGANVDLFYVYVPCTFIYLYIEMCVCVCVCVFSLLEEREDW